MPAIPQCPNCSRPQTTCTECANEQFCVECNWCDACCHRADLKWLCEQMARRSQVESSAKPKLTQKTFWDMPPADVPDVPDEHTTQTTYSVIHEAASVIQAAGFRPDLVEKLRQRADSTKRLFFSVIKVASDGSADGVVKGKWFVWAETDGAACTYVMDREETDELDRCHYLAHALVEDLFENRAYRMETGRSHWM